MHLKRARQQGFTLLEVMIATAILATGMLGIAGLQLVSLENTNSAYLRSQAVHITQDIVERMRSNPTQLELGKFNNINVGGESSASYSSNTALCQAAAGCDSATLADIDIAQWAATVIGINKDNSRRKLPQATAIVSNKGNQLFEITVRWDSKAWHHNTSSSSSDASGKTTYQRINKKAGYSFRTVIN
ncbi:MAG: type IV pilus modification protein PilV [Gammaproteobacteria bacterium]|nr:type IV pilus modification protein PilV [Gammaproteobacteria bacterium]